MRFQNELSPSSPDQLQGLEQPGPAGPIVMVNLLKFRDRARYEDGRATDLSGRAAYQIYGRRVAGLIAKHGGRVLFAGDVTFLMVGQADPLWDEVALAEYPNRAALIAMTNSPEWLDAAIHRTAGLEGQLNIETVWQPGLAALVNRA